jgi:hypothetical protein
LTTRVEYVDIKALEDVHDRHGIVVEHSRNVFGGEFVSSVADEKTSLANSTVSNNDTSVQESALVGCL